MSGDRYISQNALITEIAKIHGNLNTKNVGQAIWDTPTADVVEVRHNRIQWVNRPISAQYATVTDEYGEKHYGKVHDFIENNPVGYCGECGKRLDDTFMNYCPNCGAKMDGERKDNAN